MRSVRHGGLVLVVSALLFAAVFALRWNASDPVDGVTAMYTLPVALLAARFGLRTGLVAGLVAFGLTVFWSLARDAGFGTLAFSSRLLAFLVAGVAVGLIADQVSQSRLERLRLEDEGEAAARRNLRDGQLQALVELLSRAATLEQVAEVYTREGMRLLGAAQGGVFIDNRLMRHRPTIDPAGSPRTVEPGEARADTSLSLVAVHRELPGTRDWHTVDLAARTPPTDAARTGTFNYQRDVARIVADYPGLAAIREQSGDQAWAAGPLLGSVGVIGAIAAGYADPQPFDTEQRDLLGKVAARVAEALERASLLEVAGAERARAEASERRASLLADVGAVLAGQSGAAERMQLLLDVLVPALADMGTVELVQSGRLELLVAKHADPARCQGLEQLRRLQAGDLPAVPNLAQVVRTGQPALGTSISDLVRQWALAADPTSTGLIDDLEVDSFVAVPLRSRGAVIAGLLLMQGGSGRQFGQADLALAELVAGRAALALDNAMLFEQQRDVVTTLQHALLRGDLPLVEGVTATARYRPGMAALDVGGDWYDVVALPDGRVGITLGDVVGRGVSAAATMGQLRTAVAALAPYCSGPAEVLQRLDTFAGAVPGAELATVAYLDFDPATGLLRYGCAGHPPPVLVTAAGAGFLLGGRGVPLATASGQPWVQAELTLTEPAVLICYSDGLIERRGTDIDTMLDRLLSVTSTLADRPLTEVCDGLLEQLVGGLELGDDVALLCASLQPVPTAGRARVYHRILAARPATLVELRRDLRAWADEVGLDRVTTADLVLATGEACANAIEHAYQGERPGEVELRAWLEPGEGRLAARVTDTGRWQERAHERTGRGRGLGLIRATMTEVEIRGGPTGTTVTIGRGLRPPLPIRSDLV